MNKSEDMFIQTSFIVQLFKNEKLFIQKDFQNFIKAIEGITKLNEKTLKEYQNLFNLLGINEEIIKNEEIMKETMREKIKNEEIVKGLQNYFRSIADRSKLTDEFLQHFHALKQVLQNIAKLNDKIDKLSSKLD
ncbi:MAG: hypothetical protein J6V89_05410 [Acetobacter sp.]|nr:hypothetical protein [Acetobacter sp.]